MITIAPDPHVQLSLFADQPERVTADDGAVVDWDALTAAGCAEVPESMRQPLEELSPIIAWIVTTLPDSDHARKWRQGYRRVNPPRGVLYEPGKWVRP